MKNLIQAIIATTLTFIIAPLQGQVTIGSQHTPNTGTLLDLKQYSDGTSTKGLALPRVKLIKEKITGSENMTSTIEGATGSWSATDHTGLLVYNINTATLPDACLGDYSGVDEGVYIWNGNEWDALWSKARITRPAIEQGTDQARYPGANSYIVLKGNSAQIPIKRAFNIWRDYQGSDKTNGKILPDPATYFGLSNFDEPLDNSSLMLDVKILWEEYTDGTSINDPTIAQSKLIAGLSVSGTNENNTSIGVTTKNSDSGNALIALTINNQTIWQWHIWVPADDPENQIYGYNNSSDIYWFMDRNLGAIDTNPVEWDGNEWGTDGIGTPEKRNAHGLYYQWGRPTPIKKYGEFIPNSEKEYVKYDERENLIAAITMAKFLQSVANTYDWFTFSLTSEWDYRWLDENDENTKTPMDPCPQGWRIPAFKNGVNPLQCLTLPASQPNETYFQTQGGWIFDDFSRTIGYFPAAGLRGSAGTYTTYIGRETYIWTSMANDVYSLLISMSKNEINTGRGLYRGSALNIRCVLDQ